jgi:hypothetical protein
MLKKGMERQQNEIRDELSKTEDHVILLEKTIKM